MDKTIIIDGKPVVFRKTAGTAHRYYTRTGREFMDDFRKILSVRASLTPEATKEEKIEAVLSMSMSWAYDLAFVMAQQANPALTNVEEWLDSFDEMNIMEVLDELIPMLVKESRPSPKNV